MGGLCQSEEDDSSASLVILDILILSHIYVQALAENYKGLRLRPSEFPRLLKEIGFVEVTVLVTGGDDTSKRSVLSYRKL
jgi:hypothetical protein